MATKKSDKGYTLPGGDRSSAKEEECRDRKRKSDQYDEYSEKKHKISVESSSKSQSANSSSKGKEVKISKPGIQIKLASSQKSASNKVLLKPSAAIFNEDEEEVIREMPREAKMRMRNFGRDTPTSAGPNSFGKTKQGFCDAKKVFEKSLKQAMEKACDE